MQNETEGGQGQLGVISAAEAERLRFRAEFRAIRTELRSRVPEPEAVALSAVAFSSPAQRVEVPPINVVIHERERERTYEEQRYVPRSVLFIGKIALLVAISAGAYYGPSYVTCRQMKERGLFYFGTTIGTCVQERLAQRGNPLKAIQESILPVL